MNEELYKEILAMCEQGYTIQQSCLHYDTQTIELYRYVNPIQTQELAHAKALNKQQSTNPRA